MPRWTYRRMAASAPEGKKNPVRILGDTIAFHAGQWTDRLLCDACEERLHHWESYAAYVTRDGPLFRARDEAEAHPIQNSAFGDLVHVADVSGLDVDSLARFGVSVLWRAGVCDSDRPAIPLGRYAESLRTYLLTPGGRLPNRARLIMYMIRSPLPELEELVILPETAKLTGHFMHHFLAFGMGFQLFIGHDLRRVDSICLHRRHRALVTSGALHLNRVKKEVSRATPRGGFAKHLASRVMRS
jgi:hypothetical protein